MEIVLTALLVSGFGTASAAQNVCAIAALGVGGYIALAGLSAVPVSGVWMNAAGLSARRWPALLDELLGVPGGAGHRHADRRGLRVRAARSRRRRDLPGGGLGVLDEGALTAKAKLSQDIDQGKVVPPGIAGSGPQRTGQ